MARIDANFGRSAGVSAAQITPERRDNFNALGRAVSSVGAALEERRQFSAEVDRIRTAREDDLALAELSTRATIDFSKRLDAEADAYDGAERGFADRQRALFDKMVDEEVAKQPERRQREARLALLGVAQRHELAALDIEDRRRDAFILNETGRQTDADANAVRLDPSFYATALENHERRKLALDPSLARDFDKARSALDLAYGEARIDQDPDGFLDELKSGGLKTIDAAIHGRLVSAAQSEKDRRARQALADQKRAAVEAKAVVTAEIKGILKAIDNGLPVDASRLSNLAGVAAAGGPKVQQMFLEQAALVRGVEYIYRAPFADSEAELAAERARLSASGDVGRADATRIDALEKAHAAVRRRAEQDFAGFAIDAAPDRVPPLDIDNLDAAALRFRAGAIDAAADYYGVGVGKDKGKAYFSDAERTALARKFADDPKGAVEAAAIISALPQGTAMLAEIAPEAKELAHLGGVLAADGSAQFIDDAVAGAALTKKDGFKRATPSEAKDRARRTLGPAFALFPPSGEAAASSARLAYEARAARNGLSTEDFDAEEFDRALQEAAGAVFDRRGFRRGGVDDYRSARGFSGKVLIPNWLASGDLKNLIGRLTPADFGGEEPTDEAGNRIRPEVLKRAFPVAIGEGRYQLALGDPLSDPQWVKSGDAEFILDISKIRDRLAGPARPPAPDIPAANPTELLGE